MKIEFNIQILCACCKHPMEENINREGTVFRVYCRNPNCEKPNACYIKKVF